MDLDNLQRRHKLGVVSGVYIPVCLNIISILMFLRFGLILGRVGLLGILGLLVVSYCVDFVTTLSLSAIASNGEVKGGGAYYLISRSLGPEFGGSIGILFYLAQVLNTALNVVGLIDCLKLELGLSMPQGYWSGYLLESVTLLVCTALSLAGSGIFAKANKGLLAILVVAIISIPVSALVVPPFEDPSTGVAFTGLSLTTLRSNLLPSRDGETFRGLETFRNLFGILFPSTSGIFAGASMSGDLKNPSRAIPTGTLWGLLSTFVAYLLVILAMAASTTQSTFIRDANVLKDISLWPPIILAGECATTFFSALMGLIGAAKLMQALARDKLFPGLDIFGKGTLKADEPILAILLTYLVAQLALFANLNQIATFISMGYQMTFFVMNLACFLLKIGSAPNFRPSFKFFTWQSALAGSVLSATAMFFMHETYAATAVCLLVMLFVLIHYLSPPKHWGDVSQNLIYHQVRKYLLRLKPEHIKFWRPQIILLINDPRRQTRLIQFCNSMKKGALYILGHVIVTDNFSAGVQEAKLQQAAWTGYISEYSRIKAFVQLTMSPSITWGVRNLILSAGLGGMRPNIAVLGFYNMDELRASESTILVPDAPLSPTAMFGSPGGMGIRRTRSHRRDSSARLLEGYLPTDAIRTEGMMTVTEYMTILEDLALKYKLNVAIAKGFQSLETPRSDGSNSKKFIDLWPIQMSAELSAEGKSVLTTNFDTYTLILQLGYILQTVKTWKEAYRLRVLVFVEYESEAEASRGRVMALLEKLRIDADVLAFWLASGNLPTYENIIHGAPVASETRQMVDECLKDEDWWGDVEMTRRVSESDSGDSGPLLSGATARQLPPLTKQLTVEEMRRHRRSSAAFLADIPKHPSVSQVARLGVSMGINTQNLPISVFGDSDSDDAGDGEDRSETSDDSDLDGDFNDTGSAATEGDLDRLGLAQSALPRVTHRRKSYGGILRMPEGLERQVEDRRSQMTETSHPWQSYGTMSSSPHLARDHAPQDSTRAHPETLKAPGALSPRPSSPANSSTLDPGSRLGSRAQSKTRLDRPPLPRQNSSAVLKFTSQLVPETTITNEDDRGGPRIMFADSDPRLPRADRTQQPGLSRNSSMGRLGTLDKKDASGEGTSRVVSFVEGPTQIEDRQHTGPNGSGDAHIDIPNLLANYQDGDQNENDGLPSYPAQDAALSFNDIPSRAQHLILNELMRQNSAETAVLFTTLPIPEESTCESEEASVRYLSNIEVLCNDLPPVLLVLSNNMTVTVSI